MLIKQLVPEGWTLDELASEIMNETEDAEGIPPFFKRSEEALLLSMLLYLDECVEEPQQTVANLIRLISLVDDEVKRSEVGYEATPLDYIVSEVKAQDEESLIVLNYAQYKRYILDLEMRVRVGASLISRIVAFEKNA